MFISNNCPSFHLENLVKHQKNSKYYKANCSQKEASTQVLPYEFLEIFKNMFFTEHLWVNAYKNMCDEKLSLKVFIFSKNLKAKIELLPFALSVM